MVESGLGFDTPEDVIIWTFLQDFFKTYGHVPNVQTMRQHFTSVQEADVVDRLERVAMIKPRTRGDFLTYLEEKAKDRRNRVTIDLFKEAAKIISTGVEIKDPRGNTTKLLGALDAIRYVLDGSHGIVAPTLGSKLSGNLTQDGEDFLSRYDRVKADPRYGVGQYCGISQIDAALKGAKRYELWIHAGFTGSMKSTFALHWAYVQAVYFGFSAVYFSLEMPYVQCRNIIYTMHTAHEDFAEIREQLGIEGIGLDYEKVRDGTLSPNEEKFLKEYVVPDLGGRSTVPHGGPYSLKAEEYGSIHLEVADPDKSDFTIADLRSRAELIFSKTPFAMIVVDHAGLMSARGRYSNTTEKLNEVVRDLKRLAMSFNRGMGLAVLCLFQISREGYRAAEKNGGRYNLTHLSYANECAVRATAVLTDAGIAPIEQIEPGTRVWSRSGWKQVLHRFDQGKRRVWRVTTDRGDILEVTGNHRVRILRDGDIGWCRVRSLKPGDCVLSTRGDYPWASKTPRLPKGGRPSTHLTEALAYLLGAWDGDGKIRPDKIAFTGNRNEKTLRRRLLTTFSSVFGEDLLRYLFPSRPGSFDDESRAHRERTKWFEQLAGQRGVQVPEIILRSPARFVISYLRGLWDTDGWINSQNIVGLKMKSREFLAQVQMLMTHLGYETKLVRTDTFLRKTGKSYEGWTLRLLGYESRLQFSEEIGFTEPWKKRRLTASVQQAPQRKTTDQTYPVPEIYLGLYDDHTPYRLIAEGRLPKSHYNAMRKVRETGLVCRQAAQSMLAFLDDEGITDPRAEALRHLLALQVCRVESVERTERVEEVYDLEVDGDHEFQTGPLLSHNCERSADIVTAAWIDEALRSIDKLIFQCLKSRDQAPFERVPVRVAFTCRRLLTDDTPMSEVDAEIQHKKGGEDEDQKQWRKRTKKQQETPDLEL
jgi:intein/homing endonuclease